MFFCVCVSDPGGHHHVQCCGGCDWSVWVARLAAGVHWPAHHHSNCLTDRLVCVYHSWRQSWVSLGTVSIVRHLSFLLSFFLPVSNTEYKWTTTWQTNSYLSFPLSESLQVYFAHLAICTVPEIDISSCSLLQQKERTDHHQSANLQDVSCKYNKHKYKNENLNQENCQVMVLADDVTQSIKQFIYEIVYCLDNNHTKCCISQKEKHI